MRPITCEEEFSKNPDLKRADLEHLRQWMAAQPHLPRGVPDEQLILFLYCSHSQLEDSKKFIDAFYSIRTHSPEIYGNRDPKGDDVRRVLSIFDMCHFPRRGQQEIQIMALRLKDPDPSKFSVVDTIKTYIMVQDAFMLENGTVSEYVFLLDMQGFVFGHLQRMGISYLKMYADYIQDAFPGNVSAIHVINANIIAKTIFQLIRPFLGREMNRKIFMHTSTEGVYEHVSRDALSKDYGGSLDSFETYHKLTVDQLERCSDWFKEEATLRVDESKRPGKGKKAEKVPSIRESVTRLDID